MTHTSFTEPLDSDQAVWDTRTIQGILTGPGTGRISNWINQMDIFRPELVSKMGPFPHVIFVYSESFRCTPKKYT